MKKTLIALALATVAAPTVSAPIDLSHSHEFSFERSVDFQCGVDITSQNGDGKLLVTGENADDKHKAPRFKIVNNGANYPAGTPTDSAEISIESNGVVQTKVTGAKYDVFLAEVGSFENSQPLMTDVEGDKSSVDLKNGLEWNKEYRTQLRLQINDAQKGTLTAGEKLGAKMKLKISC